MSPTVSAPTPEEDYAGRDPRRALLVWGLGVLAISALTIVGLAKRPRPPALPIITQVPDFALTHHDGSTLSRQDLLGAPFIADFIFTRCPAICPRMTSQMRRVADSLGEGSAVKIVSISIDPEHDTTEVLARYAEQHGAGDGWYFLTGDPEAIHTLSREGFLLGVDASPTDEQAAASGAILHSNRFVLVDGKSRIRGFYDPFDEADLDRLLRDAITISKER